MGYLDKLPGIQYRVHQEQGAPQLLTEIYLIGDTAALAVDDMKSLPGVERVVRVSEEYRVLGRHQATTAPHPFRLQRRALRPGQAQRISPACARWIRREHVEQMMKALRDNGQVCTRMGAYKPRTSPYAFQGHGKACLP